jgi:hypothetical protein
MTTATTSVHSMPPLGDSGAAPAVGSAGSLSSPARLPSSSFIKFDDKQATVFVNSQHIVRFEYHPSTGRAHLQLSDGHHYYLSDTMAMKVIDQLQDNQ